MQARGIAGDRYYLLEIFAFPSGCPSIVLLPFVHCGASGGAGSVARSGVPCFWDLFGAHRIIAWMLGDGPARDPTVAIPTLAAGILFSECIRRS